MFITKETHISNQIRELRIYWPRESKIYHWIYSSRGNLSSLDQTIQAYNNVFQQVGVEISISRTPEQSLEKNDESFTSITMTNVFRHIKLIKMLKRSAFTIDTASLFNTQASDSDAEIIAAAELSGLNPFAIAINHFCDDNGEGWSSVIAEIQSQLSELT